MIFTGKKAMENKMMFDAKMRELAADMPSIVSVDDEERDIQEEVRCMAAKLDVTMGEIRSRSRNQRVVDARCMMAAYLIGLPSVRQVDIAPIFGTTQAAVSKMLKRHHDRVAYYPPYRKRWETITY